MVTRLQRPCPYADYGRSSGVPWEWKRRQTQRHQSKSQVQGRVGCSTSATEERSDVVPAIASRVWRSGHACSVLFVQADGGEAAALRQELKMGTSESPGRRGVF
jgi:hypothetical protein